MNYLKLSKPKTFDYAVFAVYSLLSFYVYYVIQQENPNQYFESFPLIFGYCLFTQVIMLHLLYKHFRNSINLIFWLLVGVFHMYLAFTLKDEYRLTDKELIGIGWLMNTVFLVVFIQIMRIISLIATGQEFIVPLKFASLFDLIDQRKANIVDTVIIILYWGVCIGLPYIWLECV